MGFLRRKDEPPPPLLCQVCWRPINAGDRVAHRDWQGTVAEEVKRERPHVADVWHATDECAPYAGGWILSPTERDELTRLAANLRTSNGRHHDEPHPFDDPRIRNRHVYLIGKTRMGKSLLMKGMAVGNMRAGRGLAFLDPHGDAVEDLLGYVPETRIGDVIYFDPASDACPSFNLLALPYPAPKLTDDILAAFKMFFGDSWGPRLEHLLRYSLLTLLTDHEPHSLGDLERLLLTENYRNAIVARATNERIKTFWRDDYPTDAKHSTSAILNKLSALLAPESVLERVFTAPTNALDFADILATGKILLVNLAKGRVGEGASRVLGAFFTTALAQASLARATTTTRPDFYLYVDEFHNYVVASFETILAESAKYRLNLALANQTLSQLPDSLRHSIFGNVGTLVAFQLSADDASRIAREIKTRAWNTADGIFMPQELRRRAAVARGDEIAKALDKSRRFPAGPNTTETVDRLTMDARHELDTCRARPLADNPEQHMFRDVPPGEWMTMPDADSFPNLEPLWYFMRVERAENVWYDKVVIPPYPPSRDRQDAIRARMRERYVASPPASAASSEARTVPPDIWRAYQDACERGDTTQRNALAEQMRRDWHTYPPAPEGWQRPPLPPTWADVPAIPDHIDRRRNELILALPDAIRAHDNDRVRAIRAELDRLLQDALRDPASGSTPKPSQPEGEASSASPSKKSKDDYWF